MAKTPNRQPKGNDEALIEIAARALNCMRFKQRHFTWFDMLPALKRYVDSVIEKFGRDEFARRVRTYGIEVTFEEAPLVSAA